MINAIFYDGMNGIDLYFVNKHRSNGLFWDFNGNKSGKLSQNTPVLPQVVTIHEISKP